ncbi:hypothetical protein FF38_04552 [Lucilia cuprina]|uniref:Uncharacterized protein n=1 Tax=Lucilia cuprina TaxID=7375 RepID=A0A0L0BT02_LUCCU|nr:hypothetical protein FF38_04552 [Lucilia cuprina]
MEEFPNLAKGSLTFGSSRAARKEMDPSGKKLKKKIADNNKGLKGTGGGPCSLNNLTALELDIDKICHLTSAAAPGGLCFGVPSSYKVLDISTNQREITTSNTSKRQILCTQNNNIECYPLPSIQTPNITDILTLSPSKQPLKSPILTPQSLKTKYLSMRTENNKIDNTEPLPLFQTHKKGKKSENYAEKFHLLRQQVEIQNKTLFILDKQAEAAKSNSEASKIQADAAKAQADAMKTQAKALREIADASKVIANAH